jgi:hypothetical protein
VLEFNAHLKDHAAAKYGEPPYGHAELSSLKAFTSKAGLDLAGSLKRLKQAKIVFDNENQSSRISPGLMTFPPNKYFWR